MTKKKKEDELAKYEANMLSPRWYNYLGLKEKRGEGKVAFDEKLSVRDEAVLDLMSDKFAKQNNMKKLREIPDESNTLTARNFNYIAEQKRKKKKGNWEEETECDCVIELSSKEARKKLGRRLTDKQFDESIHKLKKTWIEAEKVKIWFESNGHYEKEVTFGTSIIHSYKRERTGQIAPRTKTIQHRYVLRLTPIAFLLLNNDILNRRVCLFPANEERNFYRLPANCQRLFRYLSLWDKPNITIKQIADILNWKSVSNPRKYKKRVERYLERLKKEGFIVGWKRREGTRGMDTCWFIWGINSIRGLKNEKDKKKEEKPVIEARAGVITEEPTEIPMKDQRVTPVN